MRRRERTLRPREARRRRALRATLLGAGISLILVPGAFASTPTPQSTILDGRGWEMVSPVEKNGGEIKGPVGGVFQAAAGGGSFAYASPSSFGEAEGAPPLSQYLARRGPAGWSSENVSPALVSGGYPEGEGAYLLFSPNLGVGLLSNGKRCRGEASAGCPVPNPPLPGSGAPAGYRNYYLRESSTGGYRALLTAGDAPSLTSSPEEFELRFAGASPDLEHVVVSTCAALTPEATEAPGLEGCDEGSPNLYEWSEGRLRAVNLLPSASSTTPGAALAATSGAVSSDGARIYFVDLADGSLYLREGGTTKAVPGAVGAAFQTASADGSVAFFTLAAHLYRYDATTGLSVDLTPGGEVAGALGAAADGSSVYYLAATGLFRWHAGATTKVAESADAADYPPASGTARVSADGTRLAFVSSAPLTGYDNSDRSTGEPDAEVYLYDAAGGGAGSLSCISCRPGGSRPAGASSLPGAVPTGEGPAAADAYKPRALSDDGRRLFFDSADALVPGDTDGQPDVYEWEAPGAGSCSAAAGCLALVSGGRVGSATFLDASADGSDAFFLTGASLVGADPGGRDVYDARVGGGFPEPVPPVPCDGDACQGPPEAPQDPTPGTATFEGPSNPPLKVAADRRHKRHHRKHRRHRRHLRGGRR